MNKRQWTEEELAKLRELYPTTPASDLAMMFGCSSCTVISEAKRQGIERDPSFNSHNFIGRYTKRRGRYNIYK